MSGWEDLYESGKFSIDTDEPSALVKEFSGDFPPAGRIADLGCGAGRNAIFMASNGFDVDCFDLVDLEWLAKVPDELSGRISFRVASLIDADLAPSTYSGILMLRLLQYLSPTELSLLSRKVATSLKMGGLVIASFTTTGVSEIVSDSVPVFNHVPSEVIERFAVEGLTETVCREFHTVSKHIPFHSEIDVCELVLSKAID